MTVLTNVSTTENVYNNVFCYNERQREREKLRGRVWKQCGSVCGRGVGDVRCVTQCIWKCARKCNHLAVKWNVIEAIYNYTQRECNGYKVCINQLWVVDMCIVCYV